MPAAENLLNGLEDQLFGELTVAKIWGVAASKLQDQNPPTEFPEHSYGKYQYNPIDYWTSGFFPGSVWALVERSIKYPKHFPLDKLNPVKLQYAARWWATNLPGQATRTNTHDLGFVFCPSFIREYELFGTQESLDVLVTAANSLATRFDEKIGCMRSWDESHNKEIHFTDKKKDFLVIIDNMCNLDLLYYVAAKTGDLRLSTIATKHAETTLKNHFRYPEWSCYHVVNYDQETGEPKAKFTHQGYEDESAWSRGLSWAVLGFAEAYGWTKKQQFLEAAINSAEYFFSRLSEDGVPAWDFDAPSNNIKDVSAAMATALGLLKIYEHTKDNKFLEKGVKLVSDTLKFTYNGESRFTTDGSVESEKDTLLDHSTMNNNEHAIRRHADHGLVYADYYFLAVGNKLLELGVII
ncbi:glycoside hydrolase family 88 protein [Suhomyces tanzawaensis NRRL Y-17324]|uniref:Glycoside hydrolase family 88 protein n=1 Tax=Suhomyces tanzawaensis NRRL Y-17324 TaxID=984487 RepID=A0A1E4SB42_9ASCO|nr:glycoside hydrolase family 88 protein [Suhomyces tanzawaensis NRRL Y-17324]ODV76723.1 glycoside hydrolase family 88 protein [Suhomyces tanzawaensis NRRL Y-17324]